MVEFHYQNYNGEEFYNMFFSKKANMKYLIFLNLKSKLNFRFRFKKRKFFVRIIHSLSYEYDIQHTCIH